MVTLNTADQTKSPAAQTRNLIRDVFYALDRLQGAALGGSGTPDLANVIEALKYAHNALHRAFIELTQ